MRVAVALRGRGTQRAIAQLERQVLTWPPSVGLARMLGLVGLFAAAVQLLTWSFLGPLSSPAVHGGLIAACALGSVALLALPVRTLTRATSFAALAAALVLQTGTAASTGMIASPYLSGHVAIVLAAALFASVRTVAVVFGVVALSLAALASADLDLSGPDVATLGTQLTVCGLVGATSSLLASRQRHALRRVERRLSSTKRAESERRIEALTDPLTGLGNRRAFDADLASALADRRADGLVVVMSDVDGLKTINDTLGHLAGDRVLVAIGAALRTRFRAEDHVYRLGGDEFAAIATSHDPQALEGRLGRFVVADVPGAGRRRASIGAAAARPDDDPVAITARADAALYQAKHDLAQAPAVPR